MTDFDSLLPRVANFAAERDWQRFHTPKNLSMALAGEAGELLAELQWLSEEEVTTQLADGALRDRLADEVADVLLYTIRLAEVCGIDLVAAAHAKIDRNESRYPVDLARGNARKHTELRSAPMRPGAGR